MVASPTKTPRRSARKNIASTPKPPDIVDLMGSDDEPDDSLPSASQEDKVSTTSSWLVSELWQRCTGAAKKLTSKLSSPFSQAQVELKRRVARIALGNSVYPTDCRLVYNNKNCTLSLFGKRSTRRGSSESLVDIDFRDDSVLQIKSFYGNTGRQEPNFSFLAFQVKPSEANQLGKFKTSYKFDQREDADHKSYVVVQFLSDEDCRNFFSDILGGMDSGYADRLLKLHEHFEEQSEALKYVAALRSRSAKPYEKKETDNFVAGRAEDDVLLVYPFDGDTDEIEGAADELNEAKGVNAIIGVEETPTTSDEESSLRNRGSEQDATEGSFSDEKQGIVSRKSERRHFLTIQVRDFERLCPGEFLNDTLVDFWIQW